MGFRFHRGAGLVAIFDWVFTRGGGRVLRRDDCGNPGGGSLTEELLRGVEVEEGELQVGRIEETSSGERSNS